MGKVFLVGFRNFHYRFHGCNTDGRVRINIKEKAAYATFLLCLKQIIASSRIASYKFLSAIKSCIEYQTKSLSGTSPVPNLVISDAYPT